MIRYLSVPIFYLSLASLVTLLSCSPTARQPVSTPPQATQTASPTPPPASSPASIPLAVTPQPQQPITKPNTRVNTLSALQNLDNVQTKIKSRSQSLEKLARRPDKSRQPIIKTIQPEKLAVAAGKKLSVLLTGSGFDAVQGVVAQTAKGQTLVRSITGSASCSRGSTCKLSIETSKKTQLGRYQIVLLSPDKQPLVALPTDLIVTRDIIQTRPEATIDTITVNGDPNISIQRSCTDHTNTVVLLYTAGNRLAPNAELAFLRATAEYCPGNGGSYQVRFFTDANTAIINLDLAPSADEIPQRYAFTLSQQNWAAIGNILGIGEGDTLDWEVALMNGPSTSEPPPNVVSTSSDRQLVYLDEAFTDVCTPGTPPQLWSPLPHRPLHSTNKNFYWCDDPDAKSWKVCWSLPGASQCSYEHLTSDNSVTSLSYYEFEQWDLIGKEIDWKVKACTDEAGQNCGSYSQAWRAKVPLPPATPIGPGHNATGSAIPEIPPTTRFEWEQVAGADHYRFILSHTQSTPFRVDWFTHDTSAQDYELSSDDLQNPLQPGSLDRFLDGGISSWEVAACYNASDGDSVCSDWLFSPEPNETQGSVRFREDSFAFEPLFAAFQASSCTTCHAVKVNPPPSGISNTLASGINHTINLLSSTCANCHNVAVNNTLSAYNNLPLLDVLWHAPSPELDFRGKSLEELCQMAQNPGSVAVDSTKYPPELEALDAVARHLAHDPLILWAVVGGELPQGEGETDRAYPGTLQEWQNLVYDWVNAGKPCP